MSITLATIRWRSQAMLRDTDARRPWFSPTDYDQMIAEKFIAASGRLPKPYLLTESALTISGGGDTFTLPTDDYAGDVRLRKRGDGYFLEERTVEQIDALRQGFTSPPQGVPYLFALWEEADKTVQGRCWPPASSDEVLDLYSSLMADDLRAADLDAVVVDLSELGATALVNMVCGGLVATAGPKQLEERDFNPNASAMMIRDAERMLYQDATRRNNLMSSGKIQRWVV